MSIYSQYISERRRSLGLSTAELAYACGLTRGTIALLEQGNFLPSPSQAFRLALALGIDGVEFGRWTIAELLWHPDLLRQHALREG